MLFFVWFRSCVWDLKELPFWVVEGYGVVLEEDRIENALCSRMNPMAWENPADDLPWKDLACFLGAFTVLLKGDWWRVLMAKMTLKNGIPLVENLFQKFMGKPFYGDQDYLKFKRRSKLLFKFIKNTRYCFLDFSKNITLRPEKTNFIFVECHVVPCERSPESEFWCGFIFSHVDCSQIHKRFLQNGNGRS